MTEHNKCLHEKRLEREFECQTRIGNCLYTHRWKEYLCEGCDAAWSTGSWKSAHVWFDEITAEIKAAMEQRKTKGNGQSKPGPELVKE